jgi:hypothetical protein
MSTLFEFCTAVYGVVALTVAVATFIGASRMREPGVPDPENMGVFALITGLLWPVTVIGVAEAGMIVAIQRSHRPAVPAGGPCPLVCQSADPIPNALTGIRCESCGSRRLA